MSCFKVCINELRFNIEIYNRTIKSANCQADIETSLKYTTKAKIKVRDLNSSGILAKNNININEISTHTFIIRYKNNISSDDIIKYDNKYFKIIGYLDPDERKNYLKINCVERGLATDKRNLI